MWFKKELCRGGVTRANNECWILKKWLFRIWKFRFLFRQTCSRRCRCVVAMEMLIENSFPNFSLSELRRLFCIGNFSVVKVASLWPSEGFIHESCAHKNWQRRSITTRDCSEGWPRCECYIYSSVSWCTCRVVYQWFICNVMLVQLQLSKARRKIP